MNDLQMLNKLISYKTDAKTVTHKACNDFIVSMLKNHGWQVEYINNKIGNKKNIFAVKNASDNVKGGLLLSGHIDTVSTNSDAWATPPYTLTEKNGTLYGLGVCDMKYFTASILSNLDAIDKMPLKKPLSFIITSDEETLLYGINAVCDYFKNNNILPDFCIIGEPNNLALSNSNKGFYEFEVNVQGKACHSSNPSLGINAIYIMSKIITGIEKIAQMYINKGTTINVGIINGGTLCNVVPDNCKIRFDIRTFNRSHLSEITEKVKTIVKEVESQYKGSVCNCELVFKIPVFEYKDNKYFQHLKQKYGLSESPYMASTEAGFLQEIGINSVIFGAGDIKDAHSTNEKLDLKEFKQFQTMLLDIINDFCC